MIARHLTAALLLLALSGAPATAQFVGGRVVSVPVRSTTTVPIHKVTVRYLALGKANTNPRIAVVLFAGGNGYLDLGAHGTIGTGLAQNFLVRSRTRFAKLGFFVAVVDTPGQVPIDGNVRLSAQYAADMAKVIADVRARSGAAKVWLVGTSSGTLSVVGVASQPSFKPFGPSRIPNRARADGIVLTATQTTLVPGLCGKTVFDANLGAIAAPSFVVAHQDDGCACTPASSVSPVLAALTNAPAKASAQFTGGNPPISKNPCQALTTHGFLGIENAVVTAIANWIKTH